MDTSLSNPSVSDVTFARAVDLAAAGRVFTMEQLARHPQLSWRSQPERRAREFLRPYRDRFDVIPWLRNKPYLWRLTEAEKRRRGLKYRNVNASQHTEHWLAIGTVWLELVEHGLRPRVWFNEGKDIGRFDVFAMIQGTPFLMEVQLSELRDYEWRDKWKRRTHWLEKRLWKDAEWAARFCSVAPRVILVTSHKMKSTVPKGVLVSDSIQELPNLIRRNL